MNYPLNFTRRATLHELVTSFLFAGMPLAMASFCALGAHSGFASALQQCFVGWFVISVLIPVSTTFIVFRWVGLGNFQAVGNAFAVGAYYFMVLSSMVSLQKCDLPLLLCFMVLGMSALAVQLQFVKLSFDRRADRKMSRESMA